MNLLWTTSSVRGRFESTGVVSQQTCRELGLVGLAARACGLELDARRQFPTGVYQSTALPVATHPTEVARQAAEAGALHEGEVAG